MFGVGGGPVYRFYVQTATGNTFLITNNTQRAYWGLSNEYVISGQGWKPGGGAWADGSDGRAKENVQPFNRGLNAIRSLEPVTYNFKAETGRDTSIRYTRLIAQQAMVGFPELVTVQPGKMGDMEFEDLHTLDESPVMWALVNAVKELAGINETLAARVTALEMQ